MSENLSNELPVITSIDDLTETAIEELTNGDEIVVEEKIVTTKAASKTKAIKASEPVEEVAEVAETSNEPTAEVVEALAKPKRKRRTKAEIEADKAAKAAAETEG